MKKQDKILVTGASGFIGSRLLKSLYESGYTNLGQRVAEGVTQRFRWL